MDKRKLRRITFSDLRVMVENHYEGKTKNFYVSENFGMSIGINDLFHKFMIEKEPVLVDDYRIGILQNGEADITINLTRHHLKAGMLAYVGSGSIVQVNSFTDDLQISGVAMQEDFLNMALHGRLPKSFNGGQRAHFAEASETEQGVITNLLATLWTVAHQPEHNRETVHSLVSAMLHYYDGIFNRVSASPNTPTSREREILDRFIRLVNDNCRDQRALAWYASRLCITERYLGSLVKQASGQTAKQWLDRAIITTAKVMLRHTDRQVSQIAYDLHFPNNSFFCKYFKRLTGTTPAAYRNS